jgi:hypothetical protein
MSFAGKCMDLEIIIFSEINKTQKDRCHMFSLTCGTQENVKKKKKDKLKGYYY